MADRVLTANCVNSSETLFRHDGGQAYNASLLSPNLRQIWLYNESLRGYLDGLSASHDCIDRCRREKTQAAARGRRTARPSRTLMQAHACDAFSARMPSMNAARVTRKANVCESWQSSADAASSSPIYGCYRRGRSCALLQGLEHHRQHVRVGLPAHAHNGSSQHDLDQRQVGTANVHRRRRCWQGRRSRGQRSARHDSGYEGRRFLG